MMENNDGRSGADAPSGSRPSDGAGQAVSTADAASIPNAVLERLEAALTEITVADYREIAEEMRDRIERTFTGDDADLAGSIRESHVVFGTACAYAAAERLHELERLFDLRWKADMRAIKRWQEATGQALTWPDHADLVVWLLEQLAPASGIEAEEAA